MANIDYSDQYPLMEYWINNIAPKYFNMENNMNLRVGQFGYLNEIMAHTIMDNINVQRVESKEVFPNKAELASSILAYASLSKIEDINATPATMGISLGIMEKQLIESMTYTNGIGEYVIDSELVIDVEGIEFSLDYDIKITMQTINGDNIYNCMYVIDNTNPISTVSNPYINIARIYSDDAWYLFMFINVRQFTRTTTNMRITSDDIIDILSIPFQFEGDLADFNIWYKAPGTNDLILLDKFLSDSPPIDTPFCYYTYNQSNEIEINFSAKSSYFRPKFNSELIAEIFTTQGSDGVFEYIGNDISIKPGDTNVGMSFLVQITESSTGGYDKKSLEELRRLIPQSFSMRGSIVNVADLENYFNTLQDSNRMVFHKKRDDFLARIFYAFIMMKDKYSNIIPTNTNNMKLLLTDFDVVYTEEGRRFIKPMSKFEYNASTGLVTKNNETLSAAQIATKETTGFLYGNHMLMVVNDSPLSISYYINTIDKNYPIAYKFINGSSVLQFILPYIKVKRSAVTNTNKYNIEIKLSQAITRDFGIITDEAGVKTFHDEKMKVKGILYDENDSVIAYYDLAYSYYDEDTSQYVFTASFTTNDYISLTNKINIQNSLKAPSTINTLVDCLVPFSNLKMAIAVYFKFDQDYGRDTLDAVIPGMEGFTLTNIYETSENLGVDLLINLNSIINSKISAKKDLPTDPDHYYYVESVPLVRYSYLQNDDRFKNIIDIIRLKRLYLMNSIDSLKNNMSLDFKFFNTYGPSRYYNIGLTGQRLDRTNLKLVFDVRLIAGAPSDSIAQITSFIKSSVESINNSNIKVNNIYISNLTKEIETKFNIVQFIIFRGINGYDATLQSIEYTIENIDVEHSPDYIPEYININTVTNNGITSPEIIIRTV